MQCLHCGAPLAILRMLANGSFCSDEHRSLYEAEKAFPPLSGRLIAIEPPLAKSATVEVQPASPKSWGPSRPLLDVRASFPDRQSDGRLPCGGRVDQATPVPRPCRIRQAVKSAWSDVPAAAQLHLVKPECPKPGAIPANPWPKVAAPVAFELAPVPRGQEAVGRQIGTPTEFAGDPMIPRLDIHPQEPTTAPPLPLDDQPSAEPAIAGYDSKKIDLSRQRLRDIWKRAPGDLKVIAMVVPMILLLTLNAAGPRLYTKPIAVKLGSQPLFDGFLSRQWNALRKHIAERAGFYYSDDFKSGLKNWTAAAGSPVKWDFDNMGFLRPAGLGLFRPTLQLGNYQVEFIARIDDKGLGFIFRAADENNYQAVRLVMVKGGPVPEWHVIHYAVIGGHETSRSEKPLPMTISPQKFFSVHLEVVGNDFTLMIPDKVADFWSDDRLKTGGIGFFCGKGEQARVRHVEVSYQNDTLGKFCAFIASDNATTGADIE